MHVLVTITFNAMKEAILDPFFACVFAQDDRDFLLLVIDNASTDGTVDYLRRLDHPNLRVVLNERNIGFSAACNQGIAFARDSNASYITFINNDTEFDSHLFGGLVTSLNESKASGLSSLVLFHKEPRNIWFITGSTPWKRGLVSNHDWLGLPRAVAPKQRFLPTDFAPGCCLIFHMNVFKVVSGFDEEFFVYWEDVDLCRELSKHGMNIVVDTSLECLHKVSASTGGGFSDFSVFNYVRGHIKFVRKHFGVLMLSYVLAFEVARRVSDVSRGLMKPRQIPIWGRAIFSGLRG